MGTPLVLTRRSTARHVAAGLLTAFAALLLMAGFAVASRPGDPGEAVPPFILAALMLALAAVVWGTRWHAVLLDAHGLHWRRFGPKSVPRGALAGIEVVRQSGMALVVGGALGGGLGAYAAHELFGQTPKGRPVQLRVWRTGAAKPQVIALGLVRRRDVLAWLAQVEAAGVQVKHG